MITELYHLYSIHDGNGKRVCVNVMNSNDGDTTARLSYKIGGRTYSREVDLHAGEVKENVCVDHEEQGFCSIVVTEDVSGKDVRGPLDLDASRSP